MADYLTEIKPREEGPLAVARTLYGETRGDMKKYPHSARAIYEVMQERASRSPKDYWGDTPGKVAKGKNPGASRHHFSVWDADDPNKAKMLALEPENPKLAAYWDAQIEKPLPKEISHLKNATHYHATDMKVKPKWAKDLHPYGTYGGHSYYSYTPKPKPKPKIGLQPKIK